MRSNLKLIVVGSLMCFSGVIALAQPAKAPEIGLTATGTVAIDGKIDEKEWAGAAEHDLVGGGKVRFKYDGKNLFLGISGNAQGWAHVYVNDGSDQDIAVYHASAALGSITYRHDKDRLWQTSDKFVWELRDRTVTPEIQTKMDDYLTRNSWVANNNNTGNRNQIEFKLTPGKAPIRLAVVYAVGDNDRYFFPATLADDTRKNELVRGDTPQGLTFNTSQWASIVLAKDSKNRY